MRFSVSSLLTLVIAATAVAAQPGKRAPSLNPPLSTLHEVKWEELPPAPIEALTNAKRFARGLPPLNPRRRNPNRGVDHGAVHARRATPVASAPRSETSPVARTLNKCKILVKNTSTGQELGYISKNWNKYAEYGPLESSQDNALEVSFSASPDTRTDRIDLLATNGKSPAHPFLGAAVGYGSSDENLGAGSPNYLVLVGATQTPAGSSPSNEANNSFSEVSNVESASESAIWSYDPSSRVFTAEWVNTDGSSVNAHILWADQEENDLFTLTGDADAFRTTYSIDAPEVSLTCVPPTVVV
ncbi:unnamed protein product [Rhizoctonia solani]|uniref:Uncharacterized protein n=1 Tax=Rhizoctonia solani TaxID=456999 RepID=A0A8H3ALX3_9AGAM|nr:unnamed protein product [Rhizoctonia solani]